MKHNSQPFYRIIWFECDEVHAHTHKALNIVAVSRCFALCMVIGSLAQSIRCCLPNEKWWCRAKMKVIELCNLVMLQMYLSKRKTRSKWLDKFGVLRYVEEE